jgi:hypothetical protein
MGLWDTLPLIPARLDYFDILDYYADQYFCNKNYCNVYPKQSVLLAKDKLYISLILPMHNTNYKLAHFVNYIGSFGA